MKQPLALIVDDEPDIRELLDITLQRMHIDTCSAGSVKQALGELRQQHFDLCLADMRLPDGDGIDIVRHMAQHHPDTPVAMITAHGNMDTAVEALKAGAFDFVSKPVDLPVLRRLVHTALRLDPQAQEGPNAGQSDPIGRELLGQCRAITQVRQLIFKLARNQAPVFITGESGTGKELAARLIHARGPRHDKPFVAVNCGAIPAELMESELFGHVKGSFTGAVRDKIGLFQAADGGTLFLDEVADLPVHTQVKLLRAIQEKSIRPVGSADELGIDVRLISASHKDVAQMVANDAFRQDLYFRLHVIELAMPALRDCHEDIPLMVRHLLQQISLNNVSRVPRLDDAALQALQQHDYPGNFRELENILERASALCEGSLIHADDLGLQSGIGLRAGEALAPGDRLEEYLARIEREAIEQALHTNRWNRTATARRLGLSLRSLRYRMDKLGLDRADEGDLEE